MCIIVDANVASDFIKESDDAKPVLDLVIEDRLKIVCDHRLSKEWGNSRLKKLTIQFIQAGRLFVYTQEQMAIEAEKLKKLSFKSDDPHILALARVSGARVLYSKDKKLHEDFKDSKLIHSPRGRVYQNQKHKHVLRKSACNCEGI
jgi:predicted nucleic acid-binding protein